MWICLNNAFLSIVTDPESPDTLLVRARRPGDIESVFPDAKVARRPGRDYLYRASINRDEVAATIACAALKINYPNFKDSVRNAELHDAYARVWGVMANIQAVRPYGDDTVSARKREALFLEMEGRKVKVAA